MDHYLGKKQQELENPVANQEEERAVKYRLAGLWFEKQDGGL